MKQFQNERLAVKYIKKFIEKRGHHIKIYSCRILCDVYKDKKLLPVFMIMTSCDNCDFNLSFSFFPRQHKYYEHRFYVRTVFYHYPDNRFSCKEFNINKLHQS